MKPLPLKPGKSLEDLLEKNVNSADNQQMKVHTGLSQTGTYVFIRAKNVASVLTDDHYHRILATKRVGKLGLKHLQNLRLNFHGRKYQIDHYIYTELL